MLWIKSLHIIFVITWMAAIFYLPRLFVYHAMSEDQISKDRFKIMERKLYRGIMTPSMILALIFGAWLIYLVPGYLQMGWLHAKLTFVLGLVVYHFWCGKILNDFKDDNNVKNHVWFRWFNEIPVIALFVIVIMVVVKPF
ncbi:protoporphyrinogen oxidase HemJ [Reinekea sp. G2M2-21]|uniref:protoporphyrinogen oxidase HemJ n=1 Tax=Reinekea sp. G2M2-21 TaxID=2788942 RepID=UPI0018AAFA5C|nr:protoporphyrinogen oxidase HemJ [Reinekea sp. G2M2-21]